MHNSELIVHVHEISGALKKIAEAVVPAGSFGTDKAGTGVESLTESVMGVTAGLCKIADAIEHLATVMENK